MGCLEGALSTPKSEGQTEVKQEKVEVKREVKSEMKSEVVEKEVPLVSCCPLQKTGSVEQVGLVPGPSGWIVGTTSSGQLVTSTVACEPPIIEIADDDAESGDEEDAEEEGEDDGRLDEGDVRARMFRVMIRHVVPASWGLIVSDHWLDPP